MRFVTGLVAARQFGTNWSYLLAFAMPILRSNQQVFADARNSTLIYKIAVRTGWTDTHGQGFADR
jgi:hypothetical protein